MEELIQIFRMKEISIKTRIKLIKQIGVLINNKYASNVSEPLVIELCLLLDAKCGIEKDEHYEYFIMAKEN